MASTSETGHAVNIANFKVLRDKCAGFGGKYNPSNANLSVVNITTVWTDANTSQNNMITALQNSKQPINERELLFKPVNVSVTQVLNYLDSTAANKEVKKDAKGLADKIRGVRLRKPKTDAGGTPDETSVSNSHQSFVMKADTVKQFIELLKTVPEYVPNEPDKMIVSMEAYYTQMKTANDNIGGIISSVEMARIARDHALYDEGKGIIDIALACKKYVKSVYGATAPETKTVMGIKFRRIKKK